MVAPHYGALPSYCLFSCVSTLVGISLDLNADVCYARHDFPFHVMLDENVKRIAFCQADGIHVEGVLVVIDTCASDGALLVN